MLRCSRCKIMFDEYYRMPDGRILCKECWRDELNLAEMKAVQGHQQRAQVLRDKDAFEQKRKADQVRLEQLEHAIKLEKGKCHSAWSSWDDGYRTDKPYNYEEVELLKRQHLDLSRQLNQNPWFKFPSTPPFSDNTAYYHRARFISKSQSHYFETVTLPAEQEAQKKAEQERIRAEQEAQRKAEQERIRAEQEAKQRRIAAEQERKKREEECERNAKANAIITSVRTEHNITIGNEFGMNILVDCQVNYMRNKNGQIAAYFYLLKNNNYVELLDCNKKYYCTGGQVCIRVNILPTLPQQQYNNLALFIPYDELHLPKGKADLIFHVEIFDNLDVSIARSKDYNFEMNMNQASLLGVHKQNKTPEKSCLKVMLILFFVVSIGCIIFMFGGIMLGL